MFSKAASRYWTLYCHVGGGNGATARKVHGLGCRLSPFHVLTAAHVFRDYEWPTALLGDGLWRCSVVKAWPDLDIALLCKTTHVRINGTGQAQMEYPRLSERIPSLGCSLGYIGYLSLLEESGKRKGRTYFGQGHVAFFESGRNNQILLAVAGSAVQQGFSGGPVFTSDGVLTGVLVEALQYVPDLPHPVPGVNSLPLVAPIAEIHAEVSSLLRDA
jgi:hypothetical protein